MKGKNLRKNKENNKEKEIKIFEKQVMELTDEQLDNVAGGIGYTKCPSNCRYEILTNTCVCN